MQLKSKRAVITGASRGMGKAIATALLEKGAIVYGLSRNSTGMEELKLRWNECFFPVQLDISDEQNVRKWVAETFSEQKLPDILINNAGVGYFGKIDTLPSEKWHQMINTNLNGVMYLTAALVPLMKCSEDYSHIINIGSILGKVSGAEKSAYSATKFALQGFSEALFKELRSERIKVSCINPGSIGTTFFKDSGIQASEGMLKPRQMADIITFVLETPDNILIDEMSIRPLMP